MASNTESCDDDLNDFMDLWEQEGGAVPQRRH